MKEEIVHLRALYGRRITSGLLDKIEERNIIFIEDGTDIQGIISPTTSQSQRGEIKWKIYPKKAVFNINRYIAKYDFEIARKVKGGSIEKLPYTEKQLLFHRLAMLELLYEVSVILNGGQRYYNRVCLIDGTEIEPLITKFPEDCNIVIVS